MNSHMHVAAQKGDLEAIIGLLGQGADVNSRDRYGQTALMLAARAGHCNIVAALLEHGAHLNVTAKYGLSALMLAVVNDHVEAARMLANAGADLTLRGSGAPGFADKTAYDLAVYRGMAELSAVLKPTGDS